MGHGEEGEAVGDVHRWGLRARRPRTSVSRSARSVRGPARGQLTGPRVMAVRGRLTSKNRVRMSVTPKLSRRLVCMVA